MSARIDDINVLDQDTSTTAFARYLRDLEHPTRSDVGGIGDGVADDTASVQACFDRAPADGMIALIRRRIWNVAAGVVLGGGARGLIMHGATRHADAAPATVLPRGCCHKRLRRLTGRASRYGMLAFAAGRRI